MVIMFATINMKNLTYIKVWILAQLFFSILANPVRIFAVKLPTVRTTETRLSVEIQKILDAGHLRPGFLLNDESWDTFKNNQIADQHNDYWSNPAENIYTLAQALPYLTTTQQVAVKSYIQSEYTNYKPYQWTHIGSAGARREYLEVPSAYVSKFGENYLNPTSPNNYDPPSNYAWDGWDFNPFTFYALASYAQVFNNASTVLSQLRSAGNTPDNYLSSVRTEAFLKARPHILNAYIAGYYGWLKLQDLATPKETRDPTIVNWLNTAQAMRLNHLQNLAPNELSSYQAGGFIYLTRELGDYLNTQNPTLVNNFINSYQKLAPYQMVARASEQDRIADTSFGEGSYSNYYNYWSFFLAKAYAAKATRAELESYLDIPAVWRGDLFYIQNLIATIQAGSTQPTPSPTPTPTPKPGDANGDNVIDNKDYSIWASHYTQNLTGTINGDLNGDNKVDGRDYIIWHNNYGN